MTARCAHRRDDLVCTRDEHPDNPRGHTYEAAWAADRTDREGADSDE